MPNQRIATDPRQRREASKNSPGSSASRTLARRPSQRPIGMPSITASPNPIVTRNSEPTTSSKRVPDFAFSTKPRATSPGDGNAVEGKT